MQLPGGNSDIYIHAPSRYLRMCAVAMGGKAKHYPIVLRQSSRGEVWLNEQLLHTTTGREVKGSIFN